MRKASEVAPGHASALDYAVALGAVALAALIKLVSGPMLGSEAPFLLLGAAVMVSAWRGGLGPGLGATALATLVSAWFLLSRDGRAPDASLTWQMALFALEGGLISALCAWSRTAQQQAEAIAHKLLASEERARRLIETANEGIWIVNPELRTEYVNQRMAEMLGYRIKEMMGRSIYEFMDEEMQSLARANMERRRQGVREQLDFRYRRKDGTPLWTLISTAPLLDAQGRFMGALGMFSDITERKRIESEQQFLAEAGAILAASLDYPTMLAALARLVVPRLADWCVIDMLAADGTVQRLVVQHANPAKAALVEELSRRYPTDPGAPEGVAKAVRTGRSQLYSDLSGAILDAVARDAEHLSLLRATEVTSAMVVPLIATRLDGAGPDGGATTNGAAPDGAAPDGAAPDGTTGPAAGRMLGVISFGLDQAGRRFEARDLALAEELARRAALAVDNARLYAQTVDTLRARDEFLATLSHELRTPLTAVLGWITLLRSGQLEAENQAQAFEAIERNTRAQAQLIEDLLDMSRIITGKLRLEARPLHLKALLEAATATMRPIAQARRITLETCFDPDMGTVEGDESRLRQVVWNLLANALKFTPEGGRVTVRLAASPAACPAASLEARPEVCGPGVQITVSDTGQGIGAEFLPYVFDRFRQADSSTTRRHGGLGLGLAIARHIVELHGGSMSAASPGDGLGATFTVQLPTVHPPPALPAAPDAARTTPTSLPPKTASGWHRADHALAGVRVLVVDDDADARHMMRVILEGCGAQVLTADSVAVALHTLLQARPTVLASDIAMPDQDGYDLIRCLRALPPEQGGAIPALALTAYAGPDNYARALAAGYQAHLDKPVEPDRLVQTIARLAGREVSQGEVPFSEPAR